MKDLVMIGIFFLVGIAIWAISEYFNIPYWYVFAAVMPIAIVISVVVQVVKTVSYNFRPNLKLEPVPTNKLNAEVESLKTDSKMLEDRNFNKIDEFLVDMNPKTITYVFKHNEDPIYIYLYHMMQKKSFDVITFFEGEIGLTTSCDENAALFPEREPGALLEIFPNMPLDELLKKHKEAINFVKSFDKEPKELTVLEIRDTLLEYLKKTGKSIKKQPLWPIMLVIWTFTKPGLKKYGYSIKEQYNMKIIKL